MRLDKYLKDQGLGVRSELKEKIKKGRVKVNGVVCKDPGFAICEGEDEIHLDGTPISYKKYFYYMLNKPKGVITATEDRKLPTVLDLLSEQVQRQEVFPVGRLDRDTEGLLLLTNNGQFAHNLLAPKKHIPKLYEAHLDSYPGEGAIGVFKEGVVLEDGYKSLPANLSFISCDPAVARVEIYEGKFHQVKRMFKAVGATVIGLKRLSMGQVPLDPELSPGAFRELTEEEVSLLGG